jgi:hypothetical protein
VFTARYELNICNSEEFLSLGVNYGAVLSVS